MSVIRAIAYPGASGEGNDALWRMVQMRSGELKAYNDVVLFCSAKYLILKASKGKGRGVFTTIDLAKDSLVTVFPMRYVRGGALLSAGPCTSYPVTSHTPEAISQPLFLCDVSPSR